MANELRFDAVLEDHVSRGLDKIRTGFDRVAGPGSSASLFGNIGAKAVAAGFGLIDTAASAVIGVLGDARQAYQDDQKSQAQLQASLKANVAGYNGNKDAIEDVLLARERLGFSDDEQRASLSTLLVRTHNANRALELQRTAMDLARLKGIDLATATDLVGKAYSGQIGALKKAGIAVDAHATAEEALVAIQKAAAGQAEAYANTSAGKEEAAHLKVGEAMERIGEVVDRVATVAIPIFADAISSAVDVVAGFVDGVQKILSPVGAVNDLIGQIPGPWHNATTAIDETTQAVVNAQLAASKTPDAIAADLRESNKIAGVARDVIEAPIVKATDDAHDKAVAIARQTPGDIANGIRSARGALTSMAQQLGEDLKHPLTVAAERAKILGELHGKNLARGLRSQDPQIRAEAKAYQVALMNRLRDLDTKAWGKKAGDSYASGLRASYGNVTGASRKIGEIVSRFIQTRSPAKEGPLSQAGGPEGWGARFGELYTKGLTRTLPQFGDRIARPLTPPAGLISPPSSSGRDLAGGVRIVGVSADELADVIERQLYVRLQRAAPTLGRA